MAKHYASHSNSHSNVMRKFYPPKPKLHNVKRSA